MAVLVERVGKATGEVVAIAVRPEQERVVVCTNDPRGATVLTATGDAGSLAEDATASSAVRAALAGLVDEGPIHVTAAFVADLVYLSVWCYELKGGGSAAVLAIDLADGAVQELVRSDQFLPMSWPLTAAGDRFLLAETFDGETPTVTAFRVPSHAAHEVARLDVESDGTPLEDPDDEDDGVRPLITHLAYAGNERLLYLVTVDPENVDGNRVRSLPLDAEFRATAAPESLLHVADTPYSPNIGGACANPFTGEAACVMYASEWEKFVPVSRLPEEFDPLPVADLYLVRPGSPPRRLDVSGRLGVNAAFYDREADAPNLPDRFRICFDFGGAGAEVTPLIALGPDRYLLGLFGGSLIELHTDTGTQTLLHEFGEPITALSTGLDANTTFVGLASGAVFAVEIQTREMDGNGRS